MTGQYSIPVHSEQVIVEFPVEHVLLLTLNRPKSLNAMTPQMTKDLERILDWFVVEPDLWVVVVTGSGRIFCAGADLKAWNQSQSSSNHSQEQDRFMKDSYGFASLSRRKMLKPVIAAVNGGAYGGGTEIVLNCDIVIASEDARFALPEVKRGVVAAAGGIPRIERFAGHQRASEMLLTGDTISAQDARDRFGFVNLVVPLAELIPSALKFAQRITANSPDAVQSTKKGLQLAQVYDIDESFTKHNDSAESIRVYEGDNIKEGLQAFTQKRQPRWKNPAKL